MTFIFLNLYNVKYIYMWKIKLNIEPVVYYLFAIREVCKRWNSNIIIILSFNYITYIILLLTKKVKISNKQICQYKLKMFLISIDKIQVGKIHYIECVNVNMFSFYSLLFFNKQWIVYL